MKSHTLTNTTDHINQTLTIVVYLIVSTFKTIAYLGVGDKMMFIMDNAVNWKLN